MFKKDITNALRFYFITDEHAAIRPPAQAVIALQAGATMIQYRKKTITSGDFSEAAEICRLCRTNRIPFIVNDHILLAKAFPADGVHLGQEDEKPAVAREILGPRAILGISVSTPEELHRTDLNACDYLGTGPVFPTGTKTDAKAVIGLSGLKAIVSGSHLPVVAIGGITAENAALCFRQGAHGIAVISAITRSNAPLQSARHIAAVCEIEDRRQLDSPWDDEFGLIAKLLKDAPRNRTAGKGGIIVGPGDDACLLGSLTRPVITTDTQKEGIHFDFCWQTPEEIGQKAVETALSDLAASYATPAGLFVNLALPPYVSEKTVTSLYRGIYHVLERYHLEMGGGNISAGAQLSIDLFAVGQGREDIFPKRSDARPGDGLYSTGPLGLARAGLDALMRGDTTFEKLVAAFKQPRARFDAADILAENRVTCVIDISDGLAGDAGHIAKASNLSIALDLQPNVFTTDLHAYCDKYDLSAEAVALAGGEDYELLFACPPDIFKKIKHALPAACRVGQCLPFNGARLLNLPPGISSFRHGSSAAYYTSG